jgi:hypothetical protein
LKDCNYKKNWFFNDIQILNQKHAKQIIEEFVEKYQEYWSFRAIVEVI